MVVNELCEVPVPTSPLCNNSIVNTGETCDDGGNSNSDGCDSLCQLEFGYYWNSTSNSVYTVCGDGKRVPSEACDDGNTAIGDGCSDLCIIEPNGNCDLTVNPNLCDICGNFVRKPPEVCDDEIWGDGIGCASDCLSVLPKWSCS